MERSYIEMGQDPVHSPLNVRFAARDKLIHIRTKSVSKVNRLSEGHFKSDFLWNYLGTCTMSRSHYRVKLTLRSDRDQK